MEWDIIFSLSSEALAVGGPAGLLAVCLHKVYKGIRPITETSVNTASREGR